MDSVERFRAITRGQSTDYIPIFGFSGSSLSLPPMEYVLEKLVASGMPGYVGRKKDGTKDELSWQEYWGTEGPLTIDFHPIIGAKGFKTEVKIENGYEITESENGLLKRRKVQGKLNVYGMPEFIRYPVRDRDSWEFFKSRTTPLKVMTAEETEMNCRRFHKREKPLLINAGICGYGQIRNMMGTEAASLAFYDDPELIHEIVETSLKKAREYTFPLIERLKPEIVLHGEDMCYKHGMLISPHQFDAFFGRAYREMCECANVAGAAMTGIDCDGNITELTGVLSKYGVNGIFPCEVKAGNDLFQLREKNPLFILVGGLEKEILNEGNADKIEKEVVSKVPAMLEKGRYFPNIDHFVQPLATFSNMCILMDMLHSLCNNPEGKYPKP